MAFSGMLLDPHYSGTGTTGGLGVSEIRQAWFELVLSYLKTKRPEYHWPVLFWCFVFKVCCCVPGWYR